MYIYVLPPLSLGSATLSWFLAYRSCVKVARLSQQMLFDTKTQSQISCPTESLIYIVQWKYFAENIYIDDMYKGRYNEYTILAYHHHTMKKLKKSVYFNKMINMVKFEALQMWYYHMILGFPKFRQNVFRDIFKFLLIFTAINMICSIYVILGASSSIEQTSMFGTFQCF